MRLSALVHRCPSLNRVPPLHFHPIPSCCFSCPGVCFSSFHQPNERSDCIAFLSRRTTQTTSNKQEAAFALPSVYEQSGKWNRRIPPPKVKTKRGNKVPPLGLAVLAVDTGEEGEKTLEVFSTQKTSNKQETTRQNTNQEIYKVKKTTNNYTTQTMNFL